MAALKAFLLARKKAIAAGVAPVVVALALHFGWHVDVNVATTAIEAVVSFIATHQFTNKES